MEVIRLRYQYEDYRFAVREPDPMYPEEGPSIALERTIDGLIIAYSDYPRFVGTRPGDETHLARLEAAAKLLTHILHNAKQFHSVRLADVKLHVLILYLELMCPKTEAEYARDFLRNLALAGRLTYVTAKDLDVRI